MCDFDGTLCFDGHTVADDVVAALVSVAARHDVVIASARPPRDLLPVLPEQLRDIDLVGGNGALWRRAGVVDCLHFPEETRAALQDVIARRGTPVLVDGSWDFAYTGDGTHLVYSRVNRVDAQQVDMDDLEAWSKVLFFADDDALVAELSALDVVVNVHRSEGTLDVSPGSVDKATGLLRLWEGPRDFVAMGNDANDQSLFEVANWSWCVGDHEAGEWASDRVSPADVAATVLRAGELLDADLDVTALFGDDDFEVVTTSAQF